jgi:hypothetical protein
LFSDVKLQPCVNNLAKQGHGLFTQKQGLVPSTQQNNLASGCVCYAVKQKPSNGFASSRRDSTQGCYPYGLLVLVCFPTGLQPKHRFPSYVPTAVYYPFGCLWVAKQPNSYPPFGLFFLATLGCVVRCFGTNNS